MLAARIIELLLEKYPQHVDIPSLTSVSYVYFKNDNIKLQSCAQMWKTAAFQMSRANIQFKKHVITTIGKHQDTFASTRRIWRRLFWNFSPSQRLPKVMIVSPSLLSTALTKHHRQNGMGFHIA